MSLTPPEEPAEDAGTPGPSQPLRSYRDLPSAEQAEAWNRIVSDAGERMLRLVELDFERQRATYEQWCLDREHERRMERVGLWFRAAGAVVGAGGVVGYLLIAKYFVDHGAAVPAAGLLGGGVTALAALFLGNQYRKSR